MELRTGYKQTEVGLIPSDWKFELLDDNSKRGSGHTPSKKFKEYYEGDIVWVSLADSNKLDNGRIDSSEITISLNGINNSSAVLHPKGTVLMSRDAGIGKSAIAGCELCVSQHFITWNCNEKTLHNWYLYYWLQYRKSEFERIAIGSTIKTIGLAYFKLYKLPLPNWIEQTAIATVLLDTDAWISSLEHLIAKKRLLKQGAMQELLKPQNGWEANKLRDVIVKKHKTSHQSSFGLKEGKYRFFTNSSNDTEVKFFNSFDFDDEAIIANTGGVAYFKYFNGKFAAMSDCFVFSATIHTKFLYYSLKLYESLINGNGFTGSGIKHLDKSYFLNFIIFFPKTLIEQTRIATILSDIDTEITALEEKLEKAKQVKLGMMQELLTGRIRLL